METQQFMTGILCAIVFPLIALVYINPVLKRVLNQLCGTGDGAEFWVRCISLLALTGSIIMVVAFIHVDATTTWSQTLKQSIWLSLTGVFISVALISRSVWKTVQAEIMVKKTTANGGAE